MGSIRGLPKTLENTIGKGGLPSHFQVSRCDSKESRGAVASVVASPWGTPTSKETSVKVDSQGWLGCPKSGHGRPGAVKLVLGLHQDCLGVV